MRPGTKTLTAVTVSSMMLLLLASPLQVVHAATGSILAEFTPNADNGRALAFDGTHLIATYTGSAEETLYFWTTTGAAAGTVPIRDVNGAPVSCGALSWDGSQLWCGTYDGNGNVYTVNEATGLATLQFVYPGESDPISESCYGSNGYVDGIAFASDTSTLYVGADASTKVWQTTTGGATLTSFSAPYATVGSVTYSCKSGIAFEPSTFLWMAIYSQTATVSSPSCTGVTDPDCSYNTGLIAQFTEAGVYTGVSFPSIGTASGVTGQLKEGIAWDSVTFAPSCAVWALTNGLPSAGVIDAYEVPCPTTAHGAPEFGASPLLIASLGALLVLSLRQVRLRRLVP
jgi:hypothetical protein